MCIGDKIYVAVMSGFNDRILQSPDIIIQYAFKKTYLTGIAGVFFFFPELQFW